MPHNQCNRARETMEGPGELENGGGKGIRQEQERRRGGKVIYSKIYQNRVRDPMGDPREL